MEQVEGGDLIVNQGNESRPKDDSGAPGRDLNIVDGYETAVKLAQVLHCHPLLYNEVLI
jgi:hypothetical protein